MKNWTVRVYTNYDKKHLEASLRVSANSREEAKAQAGYAGKMKTATLA